MDTLLCLDRFSSVGSKTELKQNFIYQDVFRMMITLQPKCGVHCAEKPQKLQQSLFSAVQDFTTAKCSCSALSVVNVFFILHRINEWICLQ